MVKVKVKEQGCKFVLSQRSRPLFSANGQRSITDIPTIDYNVQFIQVDGIILSYT